MSKYINADCLKVVIKQAIRREELNFAALGSGGQTFCINTLEWVLTKIDSLQQEQPEVDLEKEYKEYVQDDPVFSKLTNRYVGISIAKHFYELGLNARKEE